MSSFNYLEHTEAWGRFIFQPGSPGTSEQRGRGCFGGGDGRSVKSKHTNLLQFEDVLVEVVLQPLVGKVDAELLEAVVLVILEAEDVQHSNGQELRSKTRRRRKKGLEYFFFFLN